MTIAELDKKYPLVWVVSSYTLLSYHDRWELFTIEEEARAYFDSLVGVEEKKIFKTHDIWGFVERSKEKGFSSTIEEAMMNFKAYITGKEV